MNKLKNSEKAIWGNIIIEMIFNNSLESTSEDKPFVIPVEIENFVKMEYELIDAFVTKCNNYYTWNRTQQSLINKNGKKYDVIDIVYKRTSEQDDYKKKTFYFDITKSFAAKYNL